MMPLLERPQANEHLPYYGKYIDLVTEPDVMAVLDSQPDELRRLAQTVTSDRETFRYAAGKWSIREVFGHMVDVERVFGYRALRISRRDETPLAGFDENAFVANGPYGDVGLRELVEEFGHVRAANAQMLKRVDAARSTLTASANGALVSVRALAYIMAGHVRHHVRGLRENYGIG